MKTKINDSDYGLNITIEPETIKEFATLLRYARNANSEKPGVYLSFRDSPFCNIWLKKRKPSVQRNAINSDLK